MSQFAWDWGTFEDMGLSVLKLEKFQVSQGDLITLHVSGVAGVEIGWKQQGKWATAMIILLGSPKFIKYRIPKSNERGKF